MKRVLGTLIGTLVIAGAARAANPVSVDVWVQVQNLSIAVTTSTSYDYGIQQFAAQAIQAAKFTFQNNGNAGEQFQFSVDPVNSTALTSATPVPGLWTLVTAAAAPGSEQVRLGLVMKSSAAVAADFTYPTDALTTTATTAASTSPGVYVADATSINPVAAAASHDAYTQITLPSTTAQFGHVKLTVLATAIP